MFEGRHIHRVEEEEDRRLTRTQRRQVQANAQDGLQAREQEDPTEPTMDPGWDPSLFHGDKLHTKPEKCTRIFSVQFNTFPINNTDEEKAKRIMLEALLRTSDADIMISQEDNVSWNLITAERRPKERCRQWFESLQVNSAFNTNEENPERKAHLRGGVSVWSMNDATHRIVTTGVDNTGLGRWCYTKYQGRAGVSTRVYSIYRPCKSEGPHTVYSQQA